MVCEKGPKSSPGLKPPLRVGLLLESLMQPRWTRKVIAEIAASAYAELTLVVLEHPGAPPIGEGRPPWRRHWLYRAYKGLDESLCRRRSDALDAVDISDLTRDRPLVEVGPFEGDELESLEETDVAKITEYDLDVALCLGLEPRGERIPRLARHGVWVYRLGNQGAKQGATRPPGGLGGPPDDRRVSADPDGEASGHELILCGSHRMTNRFSVRLHCDHLGWTSSEFVMRALRRLGEEGVLIPSLGRRRPSSGPRRRCAGRLGDGPDPGPIRRAARGARPRRVLRQDQWILAYSSPGQWDGPRPDLSTLRPLVPPRDRFWADPFPIDVGGRTYIFVEEYPYRTRKGHIAVIEIDERGQVSGHRKVLERDYHLSYPLVFPYRGTLYMIPETTANRTVELYRCMEFPHRWALDRVLLNDVRAADATPVEHDGRWWLFTSVAVDGAHNDYEDLSLYYAESPLGPWRPHRRNPIKSDVRSARPAGNLFRHGDTWYRPSQDCMHGYGSSIVINRITRWDAEGYEEVEAARILPDWGPGVERTHTVNACDRLLIVDARVSRPRVFGSKSIEWAT